MERQRPPTQHYPVEITTARFQCIGQIEVLGPLMQFIGDAQRKVLNVSDVRVTALAPDFPLGELNRNMITLRKDDVVFFRPLSTEGQTVQLLPRTPLAVLYTPLAVCRATLHIPAEATVHNLLDVWQSPFIPVTEASLFPLLRLPGAPPPQIPLLLVGARHVNLIYEA